MNEFMPGREARAAWIREQQAAGRMPDVDLYWCASPCALWTVAGADTADVKCTCGTAPVFLETVTAPASAREAHADKQEVE